MFQQNDPQDNYCFSIKRAIRTHSCGSAHDARRSSRGCDLTSAFRGRTWGWSCDRGGFRACIDVMRTERGALPKPFFGKPIKQIRSAMRKKTNFTDAVRGPFRTEDNATVAVLCGSIRPCSNPGRSYGRLCPSSKTLMPCIFGPLANALYSPT